MTDRPDSYHTLGLELNTHALKGVQIIQKKGKPTLGQVFDIKILRGNEEQDHAAHNPLLLSDEGQALSQAINKDLIVTCLQTGEVLVRQLEVKLKKEDKIDAVLNFQAEPLLPYSVDNAVIDRILFSDSPEGTLLTIQAARKDYLQQHIQLWNNLGIEPEVISTVPTALASFVQLFAPSELPQFVIHIGRSYTTCLLLKDNKLIAAQATSLGFDLLLQAYSKDLDSSEVDSKLHELDFSNLNKAEHPHLFEVFEAGKLEIIRTLYALSKQTKGQEISRIVATGEGAAYTNLIDSILHSLNKPLAKFDDIPDFGLSEAELKKFAIPLGAALTALPGFNYQINLRQGEFVYPKPWKRYWVPLSTYLGLCLLLSIAFYFMGSGYLAYKEDGLKREYSELLAGLNKPYTEFEKEFSSKSIGKKTPEPGVPVKIENLALNDIMDRLHYLEKDINATPEFYPLLPNLPTISDVLAWLSTHPNVVSKESSTGRLIPLLQLESFTYTIVKRPEMNRKQEKYQAKVEIEVSSPTPKLAREFHDALIAPNQLVDPKGEVKWSTNRGFYRASFFLKDKTVYSSAS